MTLNEELEFGSVPPEVQRAFRSQSATKTLLPAGHRLYKFTQYPLSHSDRVTPWWSSVTPIQPEDTGLEELLRRAERLGVSAQRFSRARNAVTLEWNSMENLLIVSLTVAAFGFFGMASHQRMEQDPSMSNVVWIGGATQLWIPNLSVAHLRQH